MTRLLVVTALTLVAFFVALYTWNRAPKVACSAEGLHALAPIWNELAEKKPRRAAEELRKLANRTRLNDTPESYEALIESWLEGREEPARRDCKRLEESLRRLK